MQISSFIVDSRRSVEILRAIAVPAAAAAAAAAVAIVLDRARRHARKAENRFGTVGQFPIRGNGAAFFSSGDGDRSESLRIAAQLGAMLSRVALRRVSRAFLRLARVIAKRYDALFAIKISIANHRAVSHSIVSACAIPLARLAFISVCGKRFDSEEKKRKRKRKRNILRDVIRSLYSRGRLEIFDPQSSRIIANARDTREAQTTHAAGWNVTINELCSLNEENPEQLSEGNVNPAKYIAPGGISRERTGRKLGMAFF